MRHPDWIFSQKFLSNSISIDLCLCVTSMVLLIVFPEAGNLIFNVVIVLAIPTE